MRGGGGGLRERKTHEGQAGSDPWGCGAELGRQSGSQVDMPAPQVSSLGGAAGRRHCSSAKVPSQPPPLRPPGQVRPGPRGILYLMGAVRSPCQIVPGKETKAIPNCLGRFRKFCPQRGKHFKRVLSHAVPSKRCLVKLSGSGLAAWGFGGGGKAGGSWLSAFKS